VPLEHTRGNGVDSGAIGDVAGLGLASELLGERLETIGTAGEQDAEVAARCEQACDLHADARRGAGDNRDPAHEKRLSLGGPGETVAGRSAALDAATPRFARRPTSSAAASSVAPIGTTIGAPCVLASQRPSQRSDEHRPTETS
jgi:hypothetical protein